MELLVELLKLVLPAGLVLLAAYLMVRSFLAREQEKRHAMLVEERVKVTLPLCLQAYERMALFLSRNSLTQLVPRVMDVNLPATGLQELLIKELREEYAHNLSQQIYLSIDLWKQVDSAVEETVMLINRAAEKVEKEASASLLAKELFSLSATERFDAMEMALIALKEEARLFMH